MARRLGFPVLVRPSYVLGGRAMVISYDEETVRRYMREAGVHSGDSSCVLPASRRRDPSRVWSLQEIHGKTAATPAVH